MPWHSILYLLRVSYSEHRHFLHDGLLLLYLADIFSSTHSPAFRNYQDMSQELQITFLPKKLTRIGTGEFTDSLIWENWTDLSRFLVTSFSTQSHAVLELKTKTTAVEKLSRLRHNRKTIVAWSLNTDQIIRDEELRTAPLFRPAQRGCKMRIMGLSACISF